MPGTLIRLLATALFGIAGLALAFIALAILPVYGAYMVLWLHVPLLDILLTVGPLAGIFAVGANAAFLVSRQTYKGHAFTQETP